MAYQGLWNLEYNRHLNNNTPVGTTPLPGVPTPTPAPATPAPSYGPGQPAPSYGPGMPGSNPISRGTNQNPFPDTGKPGMPTGDTTPGKVPVSSGNPITRPNNQYEKSFSPYGQTKASTVPSTGMGWEKYATPTGDGFTGVRNGQNFVNGHLFAAEGLNQGDASNPLGTGFGNWLRAHAGYLGIDYNQVAGGGYVPTPPALGNPTTSTPITNPGTLKGGADVNGQPLTNNNFGPFAPGTVPTNPLTRGKEPFNAPPQQIPGTNPITRNSNFVPKPVTRYDDFVTSKGPVGTPNPALAAYGNSGLSALDPRFNQSRSQGYRKPLGLTDLDTKGGGVAEVGKPNPTTPPTAGDKPGQGARVYETGPDGRNPQAEEEYNRILNGRNPWGTTEQYFRRNNNQWQHDPNADLSGLPEYLRRQYRWNSRLNEDGTPAGWEGPGTVDRNGRAVVPIGDQSQAVGGENSTGAVIDWNLVWYDNDLGMVTSPENLRQHQPGTGSRIFRGVVQTFIAAGFVYALAGAAGLYGTPSGATLTSEALTGLEAAGTAGVGTEAVATAVANLPAGTVTAVTSTNGVLSAIIDGAEWLWDGARWVAGAVGTANTISNLISGRPLITTGNRRNGMPGNGDDSGNWLTDLLGTGISNYTDNRNIRQFESRQNELLDRADYNRDFRRGFLNRHANFLENPNAMFEDPNYQAFEEDELGDLSRRFNARGMALSGNEMGGLMDHQRTLRTQYRNNELNNLRQGITLGNPERTYGDAMRYLPFLYQARGARNFDTTRNIGDLLSRVIGGQSVRNWLDQLMNGGIQLSDVPEEVFASIGVGASGDGTFNWDDAQEWWENLQSGDVNAGDDTDESWLDDIFGD